MRFANPSPPSGWVKDFHLQTAEHARHTSDTPRGAGGLMSWTASRRLVSEFRCRALRASLLHSELCAEAIRLVLFADVGADLLQFEPDGGHGVTAGPEVLACEVSFFTAQTGDCDSTLPLQKSDDRSHRMLGWNRDTCSPILNGIGSDKALT